MPKIAHTADDMISNMTPSLRPGSFVFVTTQDPAARAALAPHAIAAFQEDEGTSLILPLAQAKAAGQNTDQPMACITLTVFSSLNGIGLTAAVATALGDHAIPCNMVAAFHHDHVFVPVEMSGRAMQVLTSLQSQAAKSS